MVLSAYSFRYKTTPSGDRMPAKTKSESSARPNVSALTGSWSDTALPCFVMACLDSLKTAGPSPASAVWALHSNDLVGTSPIRL